MAQSCPILCNPVALIGLSLTVDTGLPWWLSGKNMPAMQETREAQVRSLGQEDPQRRKWQPLQYSCLENSMDRGAWRAIVHGATWGHKQSNMTKHLAHLHSKVICVRLTSQTINISFNHVLFLFILFLSVIFIFIVLFSCHKILFFDIYLVFIMQPIVQKVKTHH